MIIVYTPERAEKLARSFEAQHGYEVNRLIESRPILRIRDYGSIRIAERLYARVSKGGYHRCNITYETIDGESVIW
jgi:hypothetical protein